MSKTLTKKILSLIIVAILANSVILLLFFQVPIRARSLTEEEVQLVGVNNAFGFNLFKQICDSEDGNVVISPLSVSMVLGMALNGADGDTRQAIMETLELSGLTDEEINQSYQGLLRLLKSVDRKVILEIANSVWYDDSYQVEQEFIDTNQNYFNAEVSGIDFDDAAAPGIVNNWVNQQTRGKISKIVDSFPPLSVAALLNAVYFEGTWKTVFKESNTHSSFFHLADGTRVPCRMMTQESNFSYSINQYFEAIDLPYGNGRYNMTILLPHDEEERQHWPHSDVQWTVDDIVANLTAENWEQWTDNLHETEKILYLPRFSLEYDIKMKDALSALGMGIAFDIDNADFGRMTDEQVFIDNVTHKTYIEVDEKGTRAAAVSYTLIPTSGVGSPMRVDHPFVLTIRERHTNSIVFIGKIMEPCFNM